MGYYSQVALKTTTEGYLIIKKFNDSIENASEKPFSSLDVFKTGDGYYKICNDEIKWYDDFPDVDNFMTTLGMLEEQDIPYKFIRIGEERNDVEVLENYTEDCPDAIAFFDIEQTIYDDHEGCYEAVTGDD